VLFERKQTPPKKTKYQDYKEFLRKDFLYRCAYCNTHEAHFGGLRNFHVDHFRPKKRFPGRTLTYTNLYYACSLCNTFKGETWPSRAQLKADFRFIDPCEEDPYENHLLVNPRDGSLHAATNPGRFTNAHIRLDRPQLQKHRYRQNQARQKCEELRSALANPSLPPSWVSRAKELIDEIERESLNPEPPYEVSDLLQ